MHNKMKLLLENWRQYLNEGVDETEEEILKALKLYNDHDVNNNEELLKQLFAILDSLLMEIENPQLIKQLLDNIFDILSGEGLTDEGYTLSRYRSYRNPDEVQHETFN